MDALAAQRVAVVCASNMNRSMEAHRVFAAAGAAVRSFGVGQHVKLPGPTQRQPNVYSFGTPYSTILEDLRGKDAELCAPRRQQTAPADAPRSYTRNGLLPMLERNARLKPAPERWQAETAAEFDVVVAFEERVFSILCDDLAGRGGSARPVLLLNLDTKDNAAEAAAAAPLALQLCQALAAEGSAWAAAVERLLSEFQASTGRTVLYRIGWYGL